MLKISAHITIADSELDEQFVRASGPGGQNVNKVSTAVQLRFNVYASPALPWDVRAPRQACGHPHQLRRRTDDHRPAVSHPGAKSRRRARTPGRADPLRAHAPK